MGSQICYRFDDVCIRIFDGKEVSNSGYMCQNNIIIIVMGSGECDDSCWNCRQNNIMF